MSGFERFWDAWPRKVAKQSAQKAWDKMGCESITSVVVAAVQKQERYLWRGKDRKYIPHPASWLNAGRWEDEVEIPSETPKGKIKGPTLCRYCRAPGALVCLSCAPYHEHIEGMSSIALWANRVLMSLSVRARGFPQAFAPLAYAETRRLVKDYEQMYREGFEVTGLPEQLTDRLRTLYKNWKREQS